MKKVWINKIGTDLLEADDEASVSAICLEKGLDANPALWRTLWDWETIWIRNPAGKNRKFFDVREIKQGTNGKMEIAKDSDGELRFTPPGDQGIIKNG